MARRHWLDPLARKVLQAMGDLPEDSAREGKSHRPEAETPVSPSWCIDVNRATAEQWRQLPGCSELMVDQLLRLQQGGVQFSQIEDLAQLLDLPETPLRTVEAPPDFSLAWRCAPSPGTGTAGSQCRQPQNAGQRSAVAGRPDPATDCRTAAGTVSEPR